MYMIMQMFNFKYIYIYILKYLYIYFFCVSECNRHGVSVICLCVCASACLCVCVRSKRNESECLAATDRDLDCWDLKDGACTPRTVKSGETLVDARGDTDVQIVRYIWLQGRKTNRTIRITAAQQLYQVKRMIEGIGNVPCSTYSQTLNG